MSTNRLLHTSINGGTNGRGEFVHWPAEVYALWTTMILDHLTDDERQVPITRANYFTPRPYVDQYNRGSDKYGFTWSTEHRQVYQKTRTATFGDGTYPDVT